jgi:hypothetical protein
MIKPAVWHDKRAANPANMTNRRALPVAGAHCSLPEWDEGSDEEPLLRYDARFRERSVRTIRERPAATGLVLSTVPNTAGVAGYISPGDNASLNCKSLRSFKNNARTDANRAVGTAGHALPCRRRR